MHEAVARYYSTTLQTHGATPKGVDWSSGDSQELRFSQLLRLIDDKDAPTSILDYGCGYGALAQRLIDSGLQFKYVGFDIVDSMVREAASLIDDPRCQFTSRLADLTCSNYTFASGLFNVRLKAGGAEWHEYIVATLDSIASHSVSGFAFNMLTRYADPDRMRPDLYYADPMRYFAICKERYARNVALLHDYDLYEFTMLVRLGDDPKPLVV